MDITVKIPQDINKFCRSCLRVAEDNVFYHRLVQDKQVTNITSLFESVTSLKISAGDGLPESICDDCYESVKESYAYKDRSYDSEKKLKEILEKCSTTASKDDIQEDTNEDNNMVNLIIITNREGVERKCECKHCNSIFPSYYQLSRHMLQHNSTKTISEQFLENSVADEEGVSKSNDSDDLELISIRKLYTNEVIVKESVREEVPVFQNNGFRVESRRPVVIQFNCKVCLKRFSSIKLLDKHLCTQFYNAETFDKFSKSCSLCGKFFTDPCALSLHFLKHSECMEANMLFCEVCGQVFDCEANLDQHYIKKHINKLVWNCTECQSTFTTEVELLKHNLNHPSLTYVAIDKNFPCVLCSKICFSRNDLLEHLPTHLVLKIKCKKCEASFYSQESYYVHLKSHPGAKYICTICRKPLNRKSYLKLHMDTIHFPTTTFKCKSCGKEFKTHERLKRHIQLHSTDKRYICSTCGYTAHRGSDLQLHIRSHTKEKPFKCTFLNCQSSFTTSSHLHTHTRRHLKIRMFKCTYCPADFDTGNALKKHLMIHTGERPHSCNICDKSFIRLKDLKLHMKKHCIM